MSSNKDNVVCMAVHRGKVPVPYDIELFIFCVVYRIGLASADLSYAKLETYWVFFLEPSGHCYK